jgi:hypothetical protein
MSRKDDPFEDRFEKLTIGRSSPCDEALNNFGIQFPQNLFLNPSQIWHCPCELCFVVRSVATLTRIDANSQRQVPLTSLMQFDGYYRRNTNRASALQVFTFTISIVFSLTSF